jgi:hypothetical protein
VGTEKTSPIKALSYRDARSLSRNHMVRRIQKHVKNVIFKKVKFITSAEMRTRLVETVIQDLEVPENEIKDFRLIYRTTMMDAINTKRGTSAQTGGKIVLGKTPSDYCYYCCCHFVRLTHVTINQLHSPFSNVG